ncbi:hypothetical protein V6Z11_D07G072100 [Gossypium hirsutum]
MGQKVRRDCTAVTWRGRVGEQVAAEARARAAAS